MTEANLQANRVDAEVKQTDCTACGMKRRQVVPNPDDVPEALRNLDKGIVQTLRPLWVECGDEVRSYIRGVKSEKMAIGYRQHATMVRFSWKTEPVKKRIDRLKGKGRRRRAREAWEGRAQRFRICSRTFRREGEGGEEGGGGEAS